MTIRHATDGRLRRRCGRSGSAGSPRARRRRRGRTSSWDANRAEFEQALDANALFLAEEDGEPVGFVTAWLEDHFARIGDLYVADAGRRQRNRERARRDGGREPPRPRRHAPLPEREPAVARVLREARLPGGVAQPRAAARAARGRRTGRSFGSIHVQTDDLGAVERAVQQFVPRLPGRLARQQRHAAAQRLDHGLRRRLRSRPVDAAPPRDGAVRADGRRRARDRRRARARSSASSCSRRAASSTSTSRCRSTTGRCRPGDAIALAANPRVVARLTGADPRGSPRGRADGRLARPSCRRAQELLEQIAAAIGLEGADHGWEGDA